MDPMGRKRLFRPGKTHQFEGRRCIFKSLVFQLVMLVFQGATLTIKGKNWAPLGEYQIYIYIYIYIYIPTFIYHLYIGYSSGWFWAKYGGKFSLWHNFFQKKPTISKFYLSDFETVQYWKPFQVIHNHWQHLAIFGDAMVNAPGI